MTGQARRIAPRGFTLIEVLIVLAIILMIAGLVSVSLFERRDQADISHAKINLNTLRDGLDAFRLDFRRYPTDEEGVAVLWDKEKLDADADAGTWTKYLRDALPTDPWGNEWGYAQVSESYEQGDDENTTAVAPYDLWSNGPDGEEGTDDDIRVGASKTTDESKDFGGDLAPTEP
ncbi:MAG: type II secretion system major pseudopilin GspG [Phycisphaerales bacterium]